MDRKLVTSDKIKAGDTDKRYKHYYALPVSYCLPGTNTIYRMDNQKALKRRYKDLMEPVTDIELQSLRLEDRMNGYIEESRMRVIDSRIDKYYYHVKSDQLFRSLTEVHKYIKYGDKQQGDSSEKGYRGKMYLKPQIIGIFDFKTKCIMTQEEQINANGIDINRETEPTTNEEGGDMAEFMTKSLFEQMADVDEGLAKFSFEEIEEEDELNGKSKSSYTLSTGLVMNFELLRE